METASAGDAGMAVAAAMHIVKQVRSFLMDVDMACAGKKIWRL